MKPFFLGIGGLLILLLGCTSKNNPLSETPEQIGDSLSRLQPVPEKDLYNYFELEDSVFQDESHYSHVYALNKRLGWENILDTSSLLEIRIYQTKDWKPTEIYRLQWKNKKQRKGEYIYLQYITYKKMEQGSFNPYRGWEDLEKALVTADILNLDEKRIPFPQDERQQGYLMHPKNVTFQLLTPLSSQLIRFGSYYFYSDYYPELNEIQRMNLIMQSLFPVE